MKTGLFVGSFNPITKAHLNIARHLVNKKIVNKIIFLPVVNNEKKLESLDNRINMVNLVIDNKNYIVNDIMNEYPKFNYKVINELNKSYKDLYLIMGFDLIKKFKSFDNYLDLINNYHLIIINRDVTYKEMYKYIHKEFSDYLDKFLAGEEVKGLSNKDDTYEIDIVVKIGENTTNDITSNVNTPEINKETSNVESSNINT